MDGSRKYILDKFSEHLQNDFTGFCARHCVENTRVQLISFLISQGLISSTNLKKFTLLREYEKISAGQPDSKTQMVGTLASRFCLSERTVWSLLKRDKTNRKRSSSNK